MTIRSLAFNRTAVGALRPRVSAGSAVGAVLAVLLAGALLMLAYGGGGRDLQSLSLGQTLIFAAAGLATVIGLPRANGPLRGLAGVVGAVAVTLLWTVRAESTVRQLLLWLAYLGVCLVLTGSLRTLIAARRFVDAVIVIGGLACLFGLYLFWGAGDHVGRLYSSFYAANTFAAFLLLMLPLTLSRLACAVTRREVFDFGFVGALLATSLQLTSSRGAWFALLAVVPLVFLVLRPPSWAAAVRRLIVAALISAAAVALLANVPWKVVGRTGQLLESGNRSISDRVEYWRNALEVFKDHPVTGTGAGTFGYVHARYQRSILVYAQDPHNIYLQTAAEMGVIGLAALGALLAAIALLWVRVLRRFPAGEEHAIASGIGLGLTAFFIHSALEMNFTFPANPAMAFALVGVLGAYAAMPAPGASAPTSGAPSRWRYGLAAAMALAIVVVQVQQSAEQRFQQGRRLFFAARVDAAAGRFAAAMRWNPLNPRYPSALAEAIRVTQPEDPRVPELIRRSMALDRSNPTYSLQLARVLLQRRDYARHAEEIEALLRHSLALDPYHLPDAFQLLADLNTRLGRPAAVEGTYREAMARFGGHGVAEDEVLRAMLWHRIIPLYFNWSGYLAEDGRKAEAVSVLESLLREDPTIASAYVQLADLHIQSREYAAADQILRQGLAQVPWDESLWVRWRTRPARRTSVYEQ
jgi:O-antigen ligase/tetratricopeptide (TPR) repeat protein